MLKNKHLLCKINTFIFFFLSSCIQVDLRIFKYHKGQKIYEKFGPGYDVKLHLVVRLYCWSSWECGVPLH